MYEKMNILFIGPYRQAGDWGIAARNYLSCLKKLEDHTVSSIPIYMSNSIQYNIPADVLMAEDIYCDKFDVVIQNTLPNYFEKCDAYSIGIYYSDTKSLNHSSFIDKINIMDELWISSAQEEKNLRNSGVTIPMHIIPVPFDIDQIEQYKDIEPIQIPEINNKFTFYMMTDYTEQKNLQAAVIAYNREFSNDYYVQFIIKARYPNLNNNQNHQQVIEYLKKIKDKLRLYNREDLYLNEIVVFQDISYEECMGLHQGGDCLLISSRSDHNCRHGLEALYFGNSVICTDEIPVSSMLGDMCVKVKSTEVPIFIDSPPAQHLYTGWETWQEIDILDLQKKMRSAVNKNKITEGKQWIIKEFSYDTITKKIGDRLCQLSEI